MVSCDNPVEAGTSQPNSGARDFHPIEGVDIEDLELAPSVHQYLGEPDVVDEGVQNQWESTWLGDLLRVVGWSKDDLGFRPLQEMWSA